MSQEEKNEQQAASSKLSEDWVSVIVGLAIVLIVALFRFTSIPWPLFGMFT
jgi:hypothetical protein